jgi:hypothetical protein
MVGFGVFFENFFFFFFFFFFLMGEGIELVFFFFVCELLFVKMEILFL